MLRKLFSLVLIACFARCSYGEGHYTIVAPKHIRPHSEYHVSASLHDATEASTIRLTVRNDKGFNDSREINVQPYTTQLVQFDIGDLQFGEYSIVAEGVSGVTFTNQSRIDWNGEIQTILIQTDKAMYKPGDTVNFRVLILDLNLKPCANRDAMKVFISDSSNNLIKQWLNAGAPFTVLPRGLGNTTTKFVEAEQHYDSTMECFWATLRENIKRRHWLNATTSKGVFTGELQLSDVPRLGIWKIRVEVNGGTKQKLFEIAECVPPKFEVTIDTDKDVTFKDNQIRVTVRAKYTQGNPVRGQADIAVHHEGYSVYQPLISRRAMLVDGKFYVEFDIKKDLKINHQRDVYFGIEVSVIDDFTGSTQSGKTTVTIRRDKYMISTVDTQISHNPEMSSTVIAKISHRDGSPVVDTVNKVEVRCEWWDVGKWRSEPDECNSTSEYTIDSNGLIRIEYSIPANKSAVVFFAKYKELDVRLGYYSKLKSKTGRYLQVRVQTAKPRIDGEVAVEVTSTEPLEFLTYQILGRVDIIDARTVSVPKTKTFVFNFLASMAMLPKAQLIVYYVKDGEIVSDRVDIEFGEQLHNFVTVETSATQAKPGETIDITVSTKPGSFVGLLGVDQSAVLFRDTNDLSEIESDQYNRQWLRPSISRRRRALTTFGKASDSLSKDFNDAILLTNAVKTEGRTRYGSNYGVGVHRRRSDSFSSSVIRRDFPETWFFDSINDDGSGTLKIQKKVPDKLTSWVITGFAMNDEYGLGLTKFPSTLKVFKPFFLSLSLPYAIKRGEVVAIRVVVFNYMDTFVSAEVMLENPEQEFVYSDPSIQDVSETAKTEIESSRSKSIVIQSNDGSPVTFLITPTKTGPIKIKVKATSSIAGDSIEKTLLVLPEGVPQHNTEEFLIDLRDKGEFNDTFTIKIPENAVSDSTRITVSGVGDFIRSSIQNLDELIELPDGRGEQIMLKFVPLIVALNYLKNAGRLTKAVENKALNFMEIGYQRELTYKLSDASFSAFRHTDESGSTWLTAYVARSFIQAKNYIMVEDKIVNEALDWLKDHQAANGSFPEVGEVFITEMQGGSKMEGVPLTAFVLTAFLEDMSKIAIYQDTINRALEYIVKNVEGVDDTYSLAIAAYVTQLAKHESRTALFQKFNSKAKINGDMTLKYWEMAEPQEECKQIRLDVETAAYALLTLVDNDQIAEGLPIMKWLLDLQNNNGSPRDTVLGIEALAKYAEKIAFGERNIAISVSYRDGSESAININEGNALILQTLELPPDVRSVKVNATGSGVVLFQLSYKYNLNETDAQPQFVLDPHVNKNSNSDYLHLTVCTSFVPSDSVTEVTVAVMEVSFPSGFVADPKRIPSLKSYQGVKQVETKNGDTTIIVYILMLGAKELCFPIDGYRTHKVANKKPSPIIIYDYYDISKKTTKFYEVTRNDVCEICHDADYDGFCTSKTSAATSYGQTGHLPRAQRFSSEPRPSIYLD